MSKITSLADLVRFYRNKRGLSQTELSRLSGISPKSIENIETGANENPTLDTFLRLTLILSAATPEKLPDTMEWERFPLLAEIFFKLASYDDQSIHLFNETFPQYISLMQTERDFK